MHESTDSNIINSRKPVFWPREEKGDHFSPLAISRRTEHIRESASREKKSKAMASRLIFPLLLMIYVPAMGAACVYSAIYYMKLPFSPLLSAISMGLVFTVYTITTFSEGQRRSVDTIDVPLLKNLLISLLWGISIFAGPVMQANSNALNTLRIAILAGSIAVSMLNAKIFKDIIDRIDDQPEKASLLHSTRKIEKTWAVLGMVDTLWLFAISVLYICSALDARHCLFLMTIAFYPLVYVIVFYSRTTSRHLIDFLCGSDMLLFAAGLCWLRISA
jgi:hypothetical protein